MPATACDASPSNIAARQPSGGSRGGHREKKGRCGAALHPLHVAVAAADKGHFHRLDREGLRWSNDGGTLAGSPGRPSRHGRVLTATDSAELVTVLAMLSMEGEGGGGASLRTLKVTLRVAVAAPVEPACLPTGITRGGDVCKSGSNGEDRSFAPLRAAPRVPSAAVMSRPTKTISQSPIGEDQRCLARSSRHILEQLRSAASSAGGA